MTDKQRLADWFRNQAIAVESLDLRAPLDDLEPLGEVVGSALDRPAELSQIRPQHVAS